MAVKGLHEGSPLTLQIVGKMVDSYCSLVQFM